MPLCSCAPFTTRKLDASVTLPHGLGHVGSLSNETVRVARNVVGRLVDPALEERTYKRQQSNRDNDEDDDLNR